ncbi:branched-chain-amino-acid transaminase [soil metagenome]
MPLTETASVDGKITATTDAVIPLPDDGLYRGDGVFEVIRLYGGRPYALTDHLDRIERSAAKIELEFDRASVERELGPLLEQNGDGDGQLRIVLTRGGRRILLTENVPERTASITMAKVEYSPTVILDRVKSLSYAANMQAGRIAKAAGADDALFVLFDGTVLEAPTSSIFWAHRHGHVKTPSLELPILDSITRDRLIGELDVEEGIFDLDDLHHAKEAYLASTVREVQAISSIDGHQLEVDGPHTLEAKKAFAAVLERELS